MCLIPRFVRKTTKEDALVKRLNNINFISNLPTQGLEFKTNERQLLFSVFYENEFVSIQYPGKESDVNSTTVRPWDFYENEFVSIQYPGKESDVNSTTVRPWDFRPKLHLSNGKYLNDLSFKNIWDSLFDLFNGTDATHNKRLLKLLACEFYRIAFMIDYEFVPANTTFPVTNIQTGSIEQFISPSGIYIYTPNYEIINELRNHYPTILGASWESYFMYNDLLALNEDCKYFYNELSSTGNPLSAQSYIKKGTGRINTMLSHIAVLALILGEHNLTDLLQAFVRGKGVAPLTMDKCNNFLSDYMY